VERRAFLATLGAAAVAGCGAKSGTTATTPAATAAGGGGAEQLPGAPDDAGVLSFVLGLEQLQADLYQRAVSSTFFNNQATALLKTIADQENQHVAKLVSELKRLKAPVPGAPRLNVPLADARTMLAAAYRLENLTASAYLGQVARIQDRDVLNTVLSIQTVEGRHSAAVGALLNKTATPDGAFAAGHDMATIALVRDTLAK
jgi:rubrerythrin